MIDNPIGQMVNRDQAMALAVTEAKKGLATVRENPAVGCVITSPGNVVLSTGFHRAPGQDHAEIDAINNLPEGTDLQDCHFYVTLEPCSFEGRTPACAPVLAKLPIASVTVGMKDPHPKVNGEGIRILQEAGKEVIMYDRLQAELSKLIEIFTYGLEQQKAFVALKMASTLDGLVALKSGESQWITSAKAREHGHIIRSHHDAVLIGLNTFLWDNPKLNIRYGDHQEKEMKIILLDPEGQGVSALKTSNLLKYHDMSNIYAVLNGTTYNRIKNLLPEELNLIDVISVSGGDLDLDQLKFKLFDRDILSVLVEGGASTYSSFINQRAAQRVYHFLSTSYLGGGGGLNATADVRMARVEDKLHLKNTTVKKLKPDLLISGVIDY